MEKYLEQNNIKFKKDTFGTRIVYTIDSQMYLFLPFRNEEKDVFDENFFLNVSDNDIAFCIGEDIEYFAYQFGSKFYRWHIDWEDFKLEQIIHLGSHPQSFIHLGIHGEYELLNGNTTYDRWVEKGSYFNMEALAICERNTLAGTLAFQIACSKKGIKAIIGAEYVFEDFIVKLFVKDKKGWLNILKINYIVNVEKRKPATADLLKYSTGLVLVFKDMPPAEFENLGVFVQIDSVQYEDEATDIEYLSSLNDLINSAFSKVLINDSYYLSRDDWKVKETVNKVGSRVSDISRTQHFKTLEETKEALFELGFPEAVFDEAVKNTYVISENCNYQIDIGKHKLPKYKLDGIKDNEEFFYGLLFEGLKKKTNCTQEYLDRIETECDVIVKAGFVDYFLILWDIIKWAKSQNILVGLGRGSVGGSLIAYLLDITDIDPIKYNLLFERFLNKTRVSGERAQAADALPDIDVDFEGLRRGDVKRYMETRWGKDNVVSVGTFARMKLKSCIKDLSRVKGMDFSYINYITKFFPDRQANEYKLDHVFQIAQKNKPLYDFVQKNPDMIEMIDPIILQPKAGSVHPSAVLITPEEDDEGNKMDVFSWMPVKDIDGQLVSEWEGKYVERAGFLKEDILGIAQLDKFASILSLIKERKGKRLNLSRIPMDSKVTFDLFRRGQNEDVFQFGSSGISAFCRKLKPDNIEELIAINALYRPGPMESNAHNDFADIKFGIKKPAYDYGLKEVTKPTYGLYVYQEQIMKAVHELGGLSLSQADEVRTVMKKFDKAKMATFKEQFIKGAVDKGCDLEEAKTIWEKLERFSRYGFNRSHSAAYSITAYYCQWLKVHFPVEFYTTALHFGGDNDIPNIIGEIKKTKLDIEVVLPDINISRATFTGKNPYIYWSLTKIKNIGSKAVNKIVEERNTGGVFNSFEDFCERTLGGAVNKRVLAHLIFAGAFDVLENIEYPEQRIQLFSRDKKLSDYDFKFDVDKPTDWILKCRELTGFGELDYRKLIKQKDRYMGGLYLMPEVFFKKSSEWKDSVVGGKLMYIKKRQSKRGEFVTLTLDCNSEVLIVILWNDVWVKYCDEIDELKGRLIAVRGKVKYDSFKGMNVLYSDQDITKIVTL